MASKIVANDNRIAEIGDPLSANEHQLMKVYRSLSRADQALMRQQFAEGSSASSLY